MPSDAHAIERVAQRVKEGGHNVPSEVIRRRYVAGIRNFFQIYMPIVDAWMLIENHSNPRIIVADKEDDGVIIYNVELYNKIKNYVK